MKIISAVLLILLILPALYFHLVSVFAYTPVLALEAPTLATPTFEILTFDTSEGLSSLIKTIINWAFKFAGVFAFAMIVFAGFEYTTSGGNTSKQKEAQAKIIGAIVGIILLFAFYIILYTINPDILREPSEPPSTSETPVVTPPDQEPSTTLVNIRDMGIPIDDWIFGNSAAYLDSTLADILVNLISTSTSTSWHVHDACTNSDWPCLTTVLTRPSDDCHNYGTCVDIDSISLQAIANKNIIEKFTAAGLNVLDENDHLHVALQGATGPGSYDKAGGDYCFPNPADANEDFCWYAAH